MVMLSLLAKYRIGQKITFTKPGILKNKTFKIVDFVKASEFLDKNQIGQTNIGNGRLIELQLLLQVHLLLLSTKFHV